MAFQYVYILLQNHFWCTKSKAYISPSLLVYDKCYCEDERGGVFNNRIVCDDGTTTSCAQGQSCIGSVSLDASTSPLDELCIDGRIVL